MAFTTTTNSVAVAAADQAITVASATSFSAGRLLKVNDEFMKIRKDYTSGTSIPVLRGLEGTLPRAHAVTSNVTVGDATDFASNAPQSPTPYGFVRARELKAYGAAGAITLPTPGNDMVAVINGTGALAMTLANPTKDMDGDVLMIVANGKAAHTVTYAAGFGNGGSSYDVMTFASGAANSMMAVACNGFWVLLPGLIGGTATAVTVTIA